ncbi:MAG: hypothetical protein ACXVAJ_08355, partial [Parachlamydiaceae bacterium]
MSKILLENLKEYFTKDNYVLMLGLGFDQRYLSAFNSFPKEKAIQIIGISNVSSNELLNKQNITEFNKLSGGNVPIIGENARSILDIADGLFKYISSALQVSEQHLVIDITSLSHELLVLLIGILHNLKAMDRFTLLYVGASAYSFNTSNDNVWLSRGVRSIRSVLGFPGIMLPSKKLHLIILAGFEVERAKETIVRYEPASLSIGLGRRNESVSAAHHQKNKFFVEKLNLFVREQDTYCQDIQHFEFSCIDPQKTKDELLSHIATLEESEDRNIVICPLNTKLSTVGVALAALEKPEIQICYAE